jgi:hypothetical protein
MNAHPPLIKGIREDFKEIGDFSLRQQMQALGLALSKINDWVQERLSVSLTTTTHPYRPGDAIWVKGWNVQFSKASLERTFCCYFVYSYCSQSSRDSSLDPLQLNQASFTQVGMHPRSGFAV